MEILDRSNKRQMYKLGMLTALGCNFLWGFLPIYWQALIPIDSMVIIFYRVLLMFVVCLVIGIWQYGIKEVFKPMFEDKKLTVKYILAGIVITINWSLYIWAVNAGYVIQTCMGYYLEPLIVCSFGVIFFKEKANIWKGVSLVFACVGLAIMVIGYGQMPFIAVALGLSFATYAAIKKSVFISPILSLLYETTFLAPIALGFIIYYEFNGIGAFAVADNFQIGLLFMAGIFTATPMALYSFAANKLPLITIGLTEYISPSITLIIGIFMFKEPFDIIQFTSFVVIWIGLVFFTYGEVKEIRQSRTEAISEES
ncbi:MAG: EamA family transporter RarD [Anaerovoracaceae bacterium]